MKLDIPTPSGKVMNILAVRLAIESLLDRLPILQHTEVSHTRLLSLKEISPDDPVMLGIAIEAIYGEAISVEELDAAVIELETTKATEIELTYAEATGLFKKLYDNNRTYLARLHKYRTTIEELPTINDESLPKRSAIDSSDVDPSILEAKESIAEYLLPAMDAEHLTHKSMKEFLLSTTAKIKGLTRVVSEKTSMQELLYNTAISTIDKLDTYLATKDRDISTLNIILKELDDLPAITNEAILTILKETSPSKEQVTGNDKTNLSTIVSIFKVVNSGQSVDIVDGRAYGNYLPVVDIKDHHVSTSPIVSCELMPRKELTTILDLHSTTYSELAIYLKAIESLDVPNTRRLHSDLDLIIKERLLGKDRILLEEEPLTSDEVSIIKSIVKLYQQHNFSSIAFMTAQAAIVSVIEHYKHPIDMYIRTSIEQATNGYEV